MVVIADTEVNHNENEISDVLWADASEIARMMEGSGDWAEEVIAPWFRLIWEKFAVPSDCDPNIMTSAINEDIKSDNEMKEMAKSELENLISTEKELEKEIQIAVLPKDKDDSKNAVLEIRAGTGGDEAGLFAADLFRMYQRYSDFKSWKFEILSISESLTGSYKEAMALV